MHATVLLQARGVFDPHRRQQLVAIAQQLVQASGAGATAGAGLAREVPAALLPGVPSTWDMHNSSPEVGSASGSTAVTCLLPHAGA